MKIAWFSEWSQNVEKLPRDFNNMRTEYAWYVAQGASHYNIFELLKLESNSIDVGIIIIPKDINRYYNTFVGDDTSNWDIVKDLKRVCKKYAFMQEGASWIFQDYKPSQTFWIYNIMVNADFFLCHNERDKSYYRGLLNKDGFINPTLMIEDSIKDLPKVDRSNVIIGGNLVRYYGGFNSLIVGLEIEDEVYAPSMGRMHQEELMVSVINNLPYKNWRDWIYKLNEFKYAVHLNPNSIAGTFSLNCAYLGIPCIGNINSDTQRMCYPKTSFEPDDLESCKKVAKMLKTDTNFYDEVAEESNYNYIKYFSEERYKLNWRDILKSIS